MLLTLMAPGTLTAPAPVAPNKAPSPAALFHGVPAQLRLEVSHTELADPLSQLTSAARSGACVAAQVIAANAAAPANRPRIARAGTACGVRGGVEPVVRLA